MTVDGKPLVIIFNPANSSREGLDRLQGAASRPDCRAWPSRLRPRRSEARVHAPHPLQHRARLCRRSEEHKYAELVAAHHKAWRGTKEQPYIPDVTAGWDKRPWEGQRGLSQKPGWYFPDRTPTAFRQFLESAIDWMDQHPEQTTEERIVLLYAWNEFGEGGYIAPTEADRDGEYLKAVKAVVDRK